MKRLWKFLRNKLLDAYASMLEFVGIMVDKKI